MICEKCGYDNKEGAIVCERCKTVLVQTAEKPAEKYTYGTQGGSPYSDAPVNGYMSHTNGSTAGSSPQRSPFAGSSSSGPKEWIAYAAIICGVLAIYSSPTVVPGILLGISAFIFGIVGLKTTKRNIAVIGMITGAVGTIFSILVISAYISLFSLIAGYFTRGFGFPFGW